MWDRLKGKSKAPGCQLLLLLGSLGRDFTITWSGNTTIRENFGQDSLCYLFFYPLDEDPVLSLPTRPSPPKRFLGVHPVNLTEVLPGQQRHTDPKERQGGLWSQTSESWQGEWGLRWGLVSRNTSWPSQEITTQPWTSVGINFGIPRANSIQTNQTAPTQAPWWAQGNSSHLRITRSHKPRCHLRKKKGEK